MLGAVINVARIPERWLQRHDTRGFEFHHYFQACHGLCHTH
jgi:hypothetical protein